MPINERQIVAFDADQSRCVGSYETTLNIRKRSLSAQLVLLTSVRVQFETADLVPRTSVQPSRAERSGGVIAYEMAAGSDGPIRNTNSVVRERAVRSWSFAGEYNGGLSARGTTLWCANDEVCAD
jgi:hypothetical protein